MLNFFVSVLSVSMIGAGLAALITICHAFFADYGECKITVNDKTQKIVKGGDSLLSALLSERIFIPSACGGRGTCGLCKVKALEGAGEMLPTEEAYLNQKERSEQMRLSCQIKVRRDIRISIPEELFSIREFSATCAKIAELTPDMRLFRFALGESDSLDYVPGQYVQLLAPRYEGNDEELYRAYSIASDPAEKRIVDMIIRLVPGGICTTYCFNFLKEGGMVKFNGPYGDFKISDTDAEMIFIAGGSGIAPMRCILFEMKNKAIERKARFFFGANSVGDLCLLNEMKNFEKTLHNFEFIPTVARPDKNDEWKGERGLVTEAVVRRCSDLSASEGYLCGSPGMIDAAVKVLTKLGMKENNIFYDKFA